MFGGDYLSDVFWAMFLGWFFLHFPKLWIGYIQYIFLIFMLLIIKGRLIRMINNASHSLWYCSVLYLVIPSNFDRCRCGMPSLFKAVLFLIVLVLYQKTWVLFPEKSMALPFCSSYLGAKILWIDNGYNCFWSLIGLITCLFFSLIDNKRPIWLKNRIV